MCLWLRQCFGHFRGFIGLWAREGGAADCRTRQRLAVLPKIDSTPKGAISHENTGGASGTRQQCHSPHSVCRPPVSRANRRILNRRPQRKRRPPSHLRPCSRPFVRQRASRPDNRFPLFHPRPAIPLHPRDLRGIFSVIRWNVIGRRRAWLIVVECAISSS